MRLSALAFQNGVPETNVHDLLSHESILYGSPEGKIFLILAVELDRGQYLTVFNTEEVGIYREDGPVVDFFDLESATEGL